MAVPAPWSAIQRDGTTLALAPDKQFDLSSIGASQLTVNGTELLAGPLRLCVQCVRPLPVAAGNVSTAGNYLQINSPPDTHELADGEAVQLSTTGTLPSGVNDSTIFYAAQHNSGTGGTAPTRRLRLYTSSAAAIANDGVTGRVVLASQGTGTHTIFTVEALQEITATPEVTDESDEQVTLAWEWSGTHLSATGQIVVDYDGRILWTVTLQPTRAQKYETLYFDVPLNPDVIDYLLWTSPYDTTREITQTFTDGVWQRLYAGSSDSYSFPRGLIFHRRGVGLEWGMNSDAHFGSELHDEDSSRRGRLIVNQETGVFRIQPLAGRNPTTVSDPGNANAFDYQFRFYPLPAQDYATPGPLRLGDLTATYDVEGQAITHLRPIAEECPTSAWKIQGALIKTGDGSAYDAARAARQLRGLNDAAYTLLNLWANLVAAGWDDAYDSGMPFSYDGGYSVDCAGVVPYILATALIANPEFQALVLERYQSCLEDGDTDGLYFDLAEYHHQTADADAWGRGCYHFDMDTHRAVMQLVGAMCRDRNAWLVLHSQVSFSPMRDQFGVQQKTMLLPGEQWSDQIAALTDFNARRRFYANVSDEQRLAEWCAPLLGTPIVLIPKIGDLRQTFTVSDQTNDVLTCAGHGLPTGQSVNLSVSGGTLAAGLASNTVYFVRSLTSDTLALYLNYDQSQASPATTGRVNITGNGSGTQSINALFVHPTEWAMTERALIMPHLEDAGFYHSFSYYGAVVPFFRAFYDFGSPTSFVHWRDTDLAPVVCDDDEDLRIACWYGGDREFLALVENRRDVDRVCQLRTIRGAVALERVWYGRGISAAEGHPLEYNVDLAGEVSSWSVGIAALNGVLLRGRLAGTTSYDELVDLVGSGGTPRDLQ